MSKTPGEMIRGIRSLQWLVAVVTLFGLSVTQSWAVPVSGRVVDARDGSPIDRVTVRIDDEAGATLTNADGYWQVDLAPGRHILRFTHVSYFTVIDTITVPLSGELTIQMFSSVVDAGTIRVWDKAYDRAQQIILEAIRRKQVVLDRLDSYQFEAYARLTLTDSGKPVEEQVFLIAESQSTAKWQRPDDFQVTINRRRQSANFDAESNLITVGELLNFNNDRLDFGPARVVSPIASDALDHYQYELFDSVVASGVGCYALEVTPRNPDDKLFVGTILIAAETYDFVAVDVGLSEGFDVPFLTSLRYRQTLAPFTDSIWMPVEVSAAGGFDLAIPLPGVPSAFGFDYTAALSDFVFDTVFSRGTFNEYELVVATDADASDSSDWLTGPLVPLSQQEVDGYRRIDSIEALPTPLGRQLLGLFGRSIAVANGLAPDLYRFNRVEGPYAGVPIPKLARFGPVTVGGFGGYAFDADRAQYGGTLTLDLRSRERLRVSVSYDDRITRINGVNLFYPSDMTAPAFWAAGDNSDYWRYRGVTAAIGGKLWRKSGFSLEFRNREHFDQPVATDFSVFASADDVRANRVSASGRIVSLAGELAYDSRPRAALPQRDVIRYAPRYIEARLFGEWSDREALQSDFTFRLVGAQVRFIGLFLPLGETTVELFGSVTDGDVPPQRLPTVESVAGPFTFAFGGTQEFSPSFIGTQNDINYWGDRVVGGYMLHDFGRELWVASNLPLIKDIPFGLQVHGGAFVSEFVSTDAVTLPATFAAPSIYREIGFGITDLTKSLGLFNLAVYFTWQLSDYVESAGADRPDSRRFQFSFGFSL